MFCVNYVCLIISQTFQQVLNSIKLLKQYCVLFMQCVITLSENVNCPLYVILLNTPHLIKM